MLYRELSSGTLLVWFNCHWTKSNAFNEVLSWPKRLSGGWLSLRKIWVVGWADGGVVQDENPWFSNKREPGSSAGSSAIEGTETERGRLGRGFSIDTDLEHAIVLSNGERSMSLDAVWRVVTTPAAAASSWSVMGLDTWRFSSDGKTARLADRRFSTFSVV
jgi:hypothetical protein